MLQAGNHEVDCIFKWTNDQSSRKTFSLVASNGGSRDVLAHPFRFPIPVSFPVPNLIEFESPKLLTDVHLAFVARSWHNFQALSLSLNQSSETGTFDGCYKISNIWKIQLSCYHFTATLCSTESASRVLGIAAMRLVGTVLHRFSIGFSSKLPSTTSIALPYPRCHFLGRAASLSPYSYSSSSTLLFEEEIRRENQVGTGAQDAKKAKLYSRIGKEVVSAVKKGGPNPVSNTALAAILEKAKELDVPKEILERNMKRASEKGQEAYIEKIYEVYGYGGVSMVVEVSTDKVNRSVAAIREVVKDYGGKMADSGSVMFKFRRARVVNVKVTDTDKDQLFDIALDAGAEDVIEPSIYEDDSDEDKAQSCYKIVSDTDNYAAILSKLREEGIAFETDNGSELLPITTIEVDDEAMDLNRELISKLLELDDVDAVYADQK
ncbi:Probable transcriptional regulatory protein At2g25830 [Linum perenne]